MGVLKDIMDTLRDIDIHGSLDEYFKKKKYSSIAKQSQEGTLQFPVIVSRTSLDIENLQTISRSLERQFSSFVQIVLTMNPVLNIETEKNLATYLRKFHQNSDSKTDMNDITNFFVDIDNLKENYLLLTDEYDNIAILTGTFEGCSTKQIVETNREQLKVILEYLKLDLLNDKFTPNNQSLYKFSNNNLTKFHNRNVLLEAPNKPPQGGGTKPPQRPPYKPSAQIISSVGTVNNTFVNNTSKDKIYNGGGSESKRLSEFNLPNKTLVDNDVKKSNELVPTMLHLRLKLIDKKGDNHGTHDYLIGIKAVIHPVNSEEMISNVVNACKNNNKLFDFIRWTSGEINFLQDFVLNIKEIKTDVNNRGNGSSPWWITLKRRKALSKVKNTLLLGNQLLPNTTLVLSMQEVDLIKATYGYDLMNITFVNKIMATYFLLGFVVVDTSSQLAHFLFDGQNSYQTTTFIGLERETGSDEKKFKEMLKLINRV